MAFIGKIRRKFCIQIVVQFGRSHVSGIMQTLRPRAVKTILGPTDGSAEAPDPLNGSCACRQSVKSDNLFTGQNGAF